jgi:hypothetical protein
MLDFLSDTLSERFLTGLNDPASRSLLLAAVLGGLLAILLYRWSTTERAKVHSFYVEPPKGKWFR